MTLTARRPRHHQETDTASCRLARQRDPAQRRSPTKIAAVAVAGLTLGTLLLGSCQAHAPEVRAVVFELTLIDDREQAIVYESASLYLRVFDSDGAEDLDALYLVHDVSELFWELSTDRWVMREIDEDVWVGADRLTMPGLARFPSGQYRLIIRDLAGEEVELTIPVADHPSEGGRPNVTLSGDLLVVEPDRGAGAYEIWFYSGTQRLSRHAAGGRTDLRLLAPSADGLTTYDVYVYRREGEAAHLIGPFPYRPGR